VTSTQFNSRQRSNRCLKTAVNSSKDHCHTASLDECAQKNTSSFLVTGLAALYSVYKTILPCSRHDKQLIVETHRRSFGAIFPVTNTPVASAAASRQPRRRAATPASASRQLPRWRHDRWRQQPRWRHDRWRHDPGGVTTGGVTTGGVTTPVASRPPRWRHTTTPVASRGIPWPRFIVTTMLE
jgi:hypothetical protein